MGIELEIADVRWDPPIRRGFDVLIRLEFRAALVCDGVVRWSKDDLTAVELAYQLSRWLKGSMSAEDPFLFDSMDEEELGLLWLRREGNLWWIGSSADHHRPLATLAEPDLRGLIASFTTAVVELVNTRFSFNPTGIIDGSVSPFEPVAFHSQD